MAISDSHGDQNPIQSQAEAILKYSSNPRFVLSSGDNVTNGLSLNPWGRFFVQNAPFIHQIPFLTCPGNHDGGSKLKANLWQSLFPYHFFDQSNKLNSFYHYYDYGPIRVFFLDLYNAGKYPRIPNRDQITLLKHDLQATPEKTPLRILVLHNSFYVHTYSLHKEHIA